MSKNFEETLRNAVDRDFAKADSGWLTDRNLRFLFLLDGFDELLMEGRSSGGLEEFLKQVGRFQENCARNSEKLHRVLVTGRTLALQSVERTMPENLERVSIEPFDQVLQNQWFGKWARLVGTDKAMALQRFLQDEHCPERLKEFAREPLLLYLLAAMHRDNDLRVEHFVGAEVVQTKIFVYERTIDVLLTKQRPAALNRDITELEISSVRSILAEAGLCIIQSGREYAEVSMLKERLKNYGNVTVFLEHAREKLNDDPLRNALATFYLQSGHKELKTIEFIHKSFCEFFCADRLRRSLENWARRDERTQEFYVTSDQMTWEIYDLLGAPVLSREIVDYTISQ